MTAEGVRIGENAAKNTHNAVAKLLLARDDCRVVLDIPCGEGAFAARLLGRGLDVHAADCVELTSVPEARFTKCDMDAPLPYEDDAFDAVVSIDGIEHIERPFDFVRECHRIVRPGGVLLLSTPNISAVRSRWRWLLTGFHNKCKSPLDETRPDPRHHVNMVSFPELRYMLHSNGFRISAIRTNRVKAISLVYAPLTPFSYLVTRWVLRREEKDPAQRRRNREIAGQMFSVPVLFGESLIVEAVCEKQGPG